MAENDTRVIEFQVEFDVACRLFTNYEEITI
jgi:hypothetical protein